MFKSTPDKAPSASERMDASDLGILTAMHEQMQAAKAVSVFVSDYLSKKYRLQPGDDLTPDGQIVRRVS